MQLETLKKCTDSFRVHSFKDLEDPGSRVARKEIVVALDQYPHHSASGPEPQGTQPDFRSLKGNQGHA